MVAQASRIVNVMRDIVTRQTRNGANIGYRYGVVSGFESNGHTIDVALAGDEGLLTSDIRVPAGAYVNSGDYVMVALTQEGDYWVEQILHQNLYSSLAVDANEGRILVGDGSSYAMSPGTSGQLLFSGGANSPVYWADNFAMELRLQVKNTSGSTIDVGKVVYITGASGQVPTVSLADADAEVTSSSTIGVTNESIANNGTGYIITKGILRGMDTSAFTEGAEVWLSGTSGGLTATRPPAPQHSVRIGNVVKSHASSGELLVDIHNGFEISELHDVRLGTVSDGQVLSYNNSSSYWTNTTPVSNLDSLTDVTITSPTSGQALKYNGSAWVNGLPTMALDDLSDVTISSPASGQSLKYNGSAWVNTSPTTPAGCKVIRSTNQTLSDASNTAITFSTGNVTTTFDESSPWHSASSNPTRITPNVSGRMLVIGQVAFVSNATGSRQAIITANGTTDIAFGRCAASPGSAKTSVSVSGIFDFNGSTDYVELYGLQNSTGNLAVSGGDTFLAVLKIS